MSVSCPAGWCAFLLLSIGLNHIDLAIGFERLIDELIEPSCGNFPMPRLFSSLDSPALDGPTILYFVSCRVIGPTAYGLSLAEERRERSSEARYDECAGQNLRAQITHEVCWSATVTRSWSRPLGFARK